MTLLQSTHHSLSHSQWHLSGIVPWYYDNNRLEQVSFSSDALLWCSVEFNCPEGKSHWWLWRHKYHCKVLILDLVYNVVISLKVCFDVRCSRAKFVLSQQWKVSLFQLFSFETRYISTVRMKTLTAIKQKQLAKRHQNLTDWFKICMVWKWIMLLVHSVFISSHQPDHPHCPT